MKSFLLLTALTLSISLFPATMQAQAPNKPKVHRVNLQPGTFIKQITKVPQGTPKVRPIQATYDLTWKDRIKAGSTVITIGAHPNNPQLVTASATGKTTGIASALFPYQYNYKGTVDTNGALRTVNVNLKESTRKNTTENQLSFLDDKVKLIRKVNNKKAGTTSHLHREFTVNSPLAVDAMGVLLGARFFPLTKNQEVTSLVIPMDRPYLIKFKVLGRETRKIKGTNYKTIKMDLKIIGKVNNDRSIKTYDKVKSCTLWVSDDTERLPLEMKANLFIGHVSAFLTSRKYL